MFCRINLNKLCNYFKVYIYNFLQKSEVVNIFKIKRQHPKAIPESAVKVENSFIFLLISHLTFCADLSGRAV